MSTCAPSPRSPAAKRRIPGRCNRQERGGLLNEVGAGGPASARAGEVASVCASLCSGIPEGDGASHGGRSDDPSIIFYDVEITRDGLGKSRVNSGGAVGRGPMS